LTQHLYDRIGKTYQPYRQPDIRIAAAIQQGLNGADSVLNVGAGAGSYEPVNRQVFAVELAMTMIKQRSSGAAPVVQANSMALPFADHSFAASLAILTIHHWQDQAKGLSELCRVARERVVILTWDPQAPGFWLTDYFPEILDIDRGIFPTMDTLEQSLGAIQITTIPIPFDCTDGFLGAYWQRPAMYLDAGRWSAISTFAKLSNVDMGLKALADDLENGSWAQRYADLHQQTHLDLGYRLVVAEI